MIIKLLIINILILSNLKDSISNFAQKSTIQTSKQTTKVDSLNTNAFTYRLNNPEQTIKVASEAFQLATKINYLDGEAEACRVIGVGQYYLSKYEKALDKYLQAISYFEQNNNYKGVGKVYNNIGNLYLSNDHSKALEFYNKALVLAKKYNTKEVVAGLYMNIGVVETKKKNYQAALEKLQVSLKLFQKLDGQELIIQCLQDIGEVYNGLKQYQKAESVLNEALTKAKAKNLNYTIASVELSLANVFLYQNKFSAAKEALTNGFEYTKSLKNRDLQNDYNYALYQLEYKRKNYQAALIHLKKNFSQDSDYYRKSFSTRISLESDLFNQLENRRKNERTIAEQKYATTLFWSGFAVAGLLLALVFLQAINVKRKNKDNQELTYLNSEVSKQKEDLDDINHNLEHIIDERTKDLKAKNKILSEYSLYLSHHVRGPIATLKGIVYLQERNLIDQQECIELIKKSVFDIDDEIISRSKTLNENLEDGADKT